jgi:predicted nucleic acid-binding protein
LAKEEAKPTIQDLTSLWDGLSILATRELSEEAANTALTRGITIYDALYMEAARKLGATLYTADEKLHRASKDIAKSSLLRA